MGGEGTKSTKKQTTTLQDSVMNSSDHCRYRRNTQNDCLPLIEVQKVKRKRKKKR